MSDLLERLHGYNPPDRTIDEQQQIAIDIQDAVNCIEEQQEQSECDYKTIKDAYRLIQEQNKQINKLNKAVEAAKNECSLYVDYKKDCEAWKSRSAELAQNKP